MKSKKKAAKKKSEKKGTKKLGVKNGGKKPGGNKKMPWTAKRKVGIKKGWIKKKEGQG